MQKNSEPIWFNKNLSIEDLKGLSPNTMGAHLGMELVAIGPDFVQMKMPVDSRTHQPYGLLHGGASSALAETVGSVASFFLLDPEKYNCVGLEINANHLRGIKDGFVTATATPLHIGGTTHVWDIKIHDEQQRLVCVSRLTVAVLKKK